MKRLICYTLFSILILSCERPQPIKLVRGDCPPGSLFDGKNCFVSVGTHCSGSKDCIGGFCMYNNGEKYCTEACSEDYDCPAGYFCSKVGADKLCVKSVYSRTVCTLNEECAPCGLCINGLCELSNVCIVTLCSEDSDCGSCRVCSDGRCIPVERCGRGCTSNMDCDINQICDRDYQGRLACIDKKPAEVGMYCSGTDERECNSGICLKVDGYPYSYCSRECKGDGDCPYDYYCGVFPSYGQNRVCIQRNEYSPLPCNNSLDCKDGLKCRFAYLRDERCITTFCGLLNNRAATRYYCNKDEDCRWGVCGKLEYCKDECGGVCVRPCKEDFDCPEGYICERFLSMDGGLPYNGCIYYKEVKKDVGEFCNYSEKECKTSICIDNSDLPYCSRTCERDSDCEDRMVCDVYNGKNVCIYRATESECYRDQDCPEGYACRFDMEKSRIVCSVVDGDFSNAGEDCNKGCTSGICIAGYNKCSALCLDRSDCPPNFICVFSGLNGINGSITAKICVPDQGSLFPCVRDEGCPNGEVCHTYFDKRSGMIEPVCVKVYRESKGYNEVCSSNEECSSGVCLPDGSLDGFSGRCTKFCAVDGDCAGGDICRVVPFYYSPDYAKPVRVCAPEVEKGEDGQSCKDDPLSCKRGFCVDIEGLGPVCTERCRDHFDCLKSLTVCRLIDKIGTICLPVTYVKEE